MRKGPTDFGPGFWVTVTVLRIPSLHPGIQSLRHFVRLCTDASDPISRDPQCAHVPYIQDNGRLTSETAPRAAETSGRTHSSELVYESAPFHGNGHALIFGHRSWSGATVGSVDRPRMPVPWTPRRPCKAWHGRRRISIRLSAPREFSPHTQCLLACSGPYAAGV